MPVIEVRNLRKLYRAKPAVADVSFTVAKGEIFGILGPNGAGKTTTVECVTGLRRPDSGTVRVLGLDPRRDGRRLREKVGVQLQQCELPGRLTVREALELYASFYDDPADPARLIRRWGLTEKRDTPFGKLSGGQKQRLSIALALVGGPDIVVLDELTTGLDPQARRAAWKMIEEIREDGVTIILVTHFLDEAERLCDRIAVVSDGRIAALDSPRGLVARSGNGMSLRFRTPVPVPDGLLTGLPEVREVRRRGDQIAVAGGDDVVQAVVGTLTRHQIRLHDLMVERPTLEDAFVALTGRTFED
ncbi:ABC transporter ATP-binding protein [Actinomadura spongiicola]|uniref:ABC transporter ATP-binding protein n=1 Tax=Actinomadura spongiicola TaxID=2303421 RepID=A0A372GEP0_9ACTN|nr:ABC transporter ATP-binding protein [Actinomadura spongiicola]RFS83533.1 ABC transporter ATP-binding protein [Actinomadura spongiicola]